jgi:hypothetical protein
MATPKKTQAGAAAPESPAQPQEEPVLEVKRFEDPDADGFDAQDFSAAVDADGDDEMLGEEHYTSEETAALRAAEAEVQAAIAAGKPLEWENTVAAPSHLTDEEYDRQAKAADREFKRTSRELRRLKAQDLVNQAEHAASRRKGPPPVSLLPRMRRIDPTGSCARNSDGTKAGRPGFRKKWVPTKHTDGRDWNHNAFQHEQEGFVVVKDSVTNEPITSPYGVLMEISPRDAALRVMTRQRAGTVAPEDFWAADIEGIAQSANRAAGHRVMNVRREEDHGREEDPIPDYSDGGPRRQKVTADRF